jgi:hypothetical protein
LIDIKEEALGDPGVKLTAAQRSETGLVFSWKILREAPEGKAYFLTAKLLNVDAGNPHDEYYAWTELKGDGSYPLVDFAGKSAGSVRIMQIFVVDEACATYLRGKGPDNTHPNKLCDLGGVGEPESVGLRISIRS